MLDIKKDLAELDETYKTRPRQGLASILAYGTSGVGKTRLLLTCPRPLFIYQFDPDGSESIENYVGIKHNIFVKDFSQDDPMSPTMFEAFSTDLSRRTKEGFFNYMATVAIDSVTTFGDIVMNWILKKSGRKSQPPEIQDWGMQVIKVRDTIKELLKLPCHIVVTGHEDADKDDLLKIISGSIMITKRLRIVIPLLFSEMYRLKVEQGGKGITRKMYITPDGIWVGKSRMGHDDKLEDVIEPDIRKALKQVGKLWEDKILPE